jgi:hypothetical protein
MMKTKVLGLAVAMLGMLASCSSEIDVPTTTDEGEVCSVSFKLTVPSEMASRSFSDGKTVNELYYAVYNANEVADFNDGKVDKVTPVVYQTVKDFRNEYEIQDLTLINNRSYDIVFWADYAEDTPYTFDSETMTISVDYSKITANNDNFDAFTKHLSFKVEGDTHTDIYLKRPFAQLSFGTNDIERAKELGQAVEKSTVKYYPYKSLNLATGLVSDKSTDPVTLTSGAISFTGETFPVDGFEYLSINYILAPEEKELDTFTLIVDDAFDLECKNIPVQRNYRTNIYGSILTRKSDFKVMINPDYDDSITTPYSFDRWDGEFDWNTDVAIPDDDGVIHVETARQLARIASKLSEDDVHHYAEYTVKLECDIDMNDIDWRPIAGNEEDPDSYYFSGEFDGNNHIIKNLTINNDNNPFAGFFGTLQNAYVHNLIFEDVTIINTNTATPRTGILAAYNWGSTIENITINGKIIVEGYNNVGGLVGEMQSANGDNASIKDIKINATEGSYVKLLTGVGGYVGGIVGYNRKATIENIESNLDVIGYNCYTTQAGNQVASKAHVGGVVGGLNGGAWSYTNCKVSGNLSLYNVIDYTDENNINTYCIAIGGIVGSAASAGTVTFNQCEFTGNIFVDNQGEDYTNTVTTYNTNYKYLGCVDAGSIKLGSVTVNE